MREQRSRHARTSDARGDTHGKASEHVSRLDLLRAALTGDVEPILSALIVRPDLLELANMRDSTASEDDDELKSTTAPRRATHQPQPILAPSPTALSAWLRRNGVNEADFAEDADLPDDANPLLAHIYVSSPFAASWYAARTRGEQVRAAALNALYTQRAHPGGPFPDPRMPAAFSSRAVLATAARQLGIRIWKMPPLRHRGDPTKDNTPPLAWIITYPDHRAPDIAVRTNSDTESAENFAAAMALGYYQRLRAYIGDPLAPRGAHLLPGDPSIQALLHQFAIALLCLPDDCPPLWSCHCNFIRARLNAPPPEHPDATDHDAQAITVIRVRRPTDRPDRRGPINTSDDTDHPASSHPQA